MASHYKNPASKFSQRESRDLKVPNSHRPTPHTFEDKTIVPENIKERKLLDHIARLEEVIASKNLQLSRRVPVPYGSYCSSGATPHLLDRYSEKVLYNLVNFVRYSIPFETPNEIANILKARVSKIFFSKFEQLDFGMKGEFLIRIRGLLPEESLMEFRAFSAYSDCPEDEAKEAVKPYMSKYEGFFDNKLEKIQKTCGQVEPPVEFSKDSWDHFRNLAMNVWILHKLAFSFESANVRLVRVVPDDPFIDKFMEPMGQQDEDQLKGKSPATTKVKHVIVPGLWINNSVIKCRVYLGSVNGQEPCTVPATQLRGGDVVNGTGPRNVDVTPKQAQQPTSSQVRDIREAPAAHVHVHAHQQTQPMEYTMHTTSTMTHEPHVSEASHTQLPDKTPAMELDQTTQELMIMDITNSSPEEPEEEPPGPSCNLGNR